jgi:hypothetical protein
MQFFTGQIGTGHRGIQDTVLTEQFHTIKVHNKAYSTIK